MGSLEDTRLTFRGKPKQSMSYAAESGDIAFALTGDTLLTRRLAVYAEERYLALRDLLRGADVAFTNFESTARSYDQGDAIPTEATYMTTEPALLEDLKWLGINLVSCANNHSCDYSEAGVVANLRSLEAAGLAHAGTGRSLREARSPAYLDTARGRVALLATTATFEERDRAGEQRPDLRGKPGVSALGARATYEVDRAAFAELRRTSEGLGLEAEKARRRDFGFFPPWELEPEPEGELRFLGRRFVAAGGFAIRSEPNERDAEDILRQVREARRQADWVMVSIHSHEMGGRAFHTAQERIDLEKPAAFVQAFARRCIENGADLVACHGPHLTLGVEIYQGRPIFHSLGDFILQNETVRFFPAFAYERYGLDSQSTPADLLDFRSQGNTKGHPGNRHYWETFCAVCRFSGRQLARIELHPVELGHGRPRAQRGRPMLAEGEAAVRILERAARMSAVWGTRVEVESGVGLVQF